MRPPGRAPRSTPLACLCAAALASAAACTSPAADRAGAGVDAGARGGRARRRLVFGNVPSHNVVERLAQMEPLARLLGDAIDADLDPVFAGDYEGTRRALEQRRYDLAIVGPLLYVTVRDAGYVPLARPVRDGKATYRSVILARRDGPVKSLADLRGRRIAFVDPFSTGGYFFPRLMLMEAGLDPDRDVGSVGFVRSHDNVVLNVLSGVYDAGGCYAGAERAATASTPARLGELRVLAESDEIPADPLVAREGLGAPTLARLRGALVGLRATDEGRRILAGLKIDGYVETRRADYDVLAARIDAARGRVDR